MKVNGFLSLVFILFIFYSCEQEYDLTTSVFIQDEVHEGLPKYTEWGYNTFGIYYGRQPFVSNKQVVPFTVYIQEDTTNFIFQGTFGYPSSAVLKIQFPGMTFNRYQDMMTLDGSKVNFKDAGARVTFTVNDQEQYLDIINGEMEFKRLQRLFVDDDLEQLILSGTFSFSIVSDGIPVSFSFGRFDFGLSEINFFLL